MFLGKNTNITITAELPDMKAVSPYNVFDNLTESTGNEKHDICWDPHAAG